MSLKAPGAPGARRLRLAFKPISMLGCWSLSPLAGMAAAVCTAMQTQEHRDRQRRGECAELHALPSCCMRERNAFLVEAAMFFARGLAASSEGTPEDMLLLQLCMPCIACRCAYRYLHTLVCRIVSLVPCKGLLLSSAKTVGGGWGDLAVTVSIL